MSKIVKSRIHKRFGLYMATSLIAVCVYLPGITNSLLADDWSVIVRNMDLSSQDALARFYSTFAGWYRPMFDVLMNLCFQIFGFKATGYHLVALFLYIAITYLVGDIAETITGKRSIGLISSLLFGIHSVHAEPVLWVSSMNELLAGLFVLLSLKSYIAFRGSDKPILNYCLTGLFYILGLASKETALFLPIMFVGYDFFLWSGIRSKTNRIDWRILLNVPFVIIQIIYLAFRLQAGSPYSTQVSLLRVVINGLYYFAVQVLMLPENYGYLSSLSLWRQAPLLPVLSVGISAAIMGMFVWFYIRFSSRRISPDYIKASKFTCAWSLVALSPVILTATGRTAFMSSIGVVWTMAIFLFAIWDKIKISDTVYKKVFVTGGVVFICINLVISSYRVYWWRQASEVTQNVIYQLDNELRIIPKGKEICLIGLPDHLHHAYTFRNAFPYIGQILYSDYRIQVTLDTEFSNLPESSQNCVMYQYKGNMLERLDNAY
ncbi:MAG: hypothetical protein B6I38_07120 [Anaerolineaceae bacterium 4572_5.1]|nr:MAG: hypothetical protein B6I38_07120 [Anaerolineaceae bacterium 4572_5.1]